MLQLRVLLVILDVYVSHAYRPENNAGVSIDAEGQVQSNGRQTPRGGYSASPVAAAPSNECVPACPLGWVGWEAALDPNSNKYYYFHRGSGERIWSFVLPHGWVTALDPKTNAYFYHNPVTLKSVWTVQETQTGSLLGKFPTALDASLRFSLATSTRPSAPFVAYRGNKWSCCCKEEGKVTEKSAAVCVTGEDRERKVALVALKKDGTLLPAPEQLCCKARSSWHGGGCNTIRPYRNRLDRYSTDGTEGADATFDLHSCEQKGGIDPEDRMYASYDCTGYTGQCKDVGEIKDTCDSWNRKVKDPGCKGIVKANCFLMKVLKDIVPGIRDMGVLKNAGVIAKEEANLLLDGAGLVAGVAGQIALGGLVAGTAMNIMTLISDLCVIFYDPQRHLSCTTGKTLFSVVVCVTALLLALTAIGTGPVFIAIVLASPIVTQIGNEICTLGWKCAAKKWLGTMDEWKDVFAEFRKQTTAAQAIKIANKMRDEAVMLMKYVVELVVTLVWSVMKLVFRVMAFVPRLIMHTIRDWGSTKNQSAREAEAENIACCRLNPMATESESIEEHLGPMLEERASVKCTPSDPKDPFKDDCKPDDPKCSIDPACAVSCATPMSELRK